MPSAPPVHVPVGRFAGGYRLLMLLALLAILLIGFLAWHSGLALQGLLALWLTWLLVVLLVWRVAPLEVLPEGELGWDGEAWWFRGNGGAPELVHVRLRWDAGRAMLLGVSAEQPKWPFERYTWLQASEMPLQWHGLRCAVHVGETI